MNPEISIVIPVYNSALYLSECIQSLKKIKFKNFEVIFIDNHSQDGSFKILKKLDRNNYRVYRNRKNFGQSYSLNKGIRLSRAKYIAIMDSDDVCLPNRLQDSINFLSRNPSYVLVAGTSNTIDENTKLLKRRMFSHDINIIRSRLLIENPISHTTVMFKKSIFKKVGYYSRDYNYAQDFDLFSRIILKNYKIKILKKNFTLVRKHKNQQSSKNKKKQALERYQIAFKNLKKIKSFNKQINLLLKFIIFNENKEFEKINEEKKIELINNFLSLFLKNNQMRFFFCTLLFSRKNKFNKILRIKLLIKYLLLNKLFFFKKEIFLRFCKSFFNTIF